jgi:hypothetical protein
LTFAVTILDAVKAAPKTVGSTGANKPSLDDISTDDIDSWLVGPNAAASADQPTAVYGGDTITISAFKDASASAAAPPKPAAPPSASDDEYERQPDDEEPEEEEEPFDQEDDDDETIGEDSAVTVDEVPEEFMDESNPFYAAKKAQKLQAKQGPAGPAKDAFKDTSDAAGDILRRLMERRRAEKGN